MRIGDRGRPTDDILVFQSVEVSLDVMSALNDVGHTTHVEMAAPNVTPGHRRRMGQRYARRARATGSVVHVKVFLMGSVRNSHHRKASTPICEEPDCISPCRIAFRFVE